LNAGGQPAETLAGLILDVSPGGLLLSSADSIPSGDVLVSFVDFENGRPEIKCKRVYSLKAGNGVANSGLSLTGPKEDRVKFVTRLIKTHFLNQRKKPAGKPDPNG
jgi:hypothetical protein